MSETRDDTIFARIQRDMVAAMRAKDQAKLGVLRMLKAKMMEKEVELRAKRGRDFKLGDEEALDVLTSYAKQRRDSIEAYEAGGRQEMADRERAELDVVSSYMPRELSEDELRALVAEAVASTGAAGPKDMGKVMQVLVPRTKGRADGKLVSGLVREALSSS